jgi:meiosis-specific transcription factor NDT80
MAEENWTCYRRNYFSLTCSYTISPYLPLATLHLIQGNSSLQIHNFAVSISAVVDGRDGKPIELVQHTPKRDKGPQETPGRITLAPRAVSAYGGSGDMSLGSRSLYDSGYTQNSGQPPTEYTFERIQFKQATANNGKRRAAQQYYHLLIELLVDVGPQLGDTRWVKVAQRVSAPMVVRGRSPGHYQNERRGSNASTGNGSSGQAGGNGAYTSSNGFSRPGDGGSTSMLPSSGYSANYDQHTRNYMSSPNSHIATPIYSLVSQDEDKYVAESPSHYGWHGSISSVERSPTQIHPHSHTHHNTYSGTSQAGYRDAYSYQLPSMPGMSVNGSFPTSPKIKPEYTSMGHSGWALPPPCAKYETRGFFAPTYTGEHSVNGS